ncbi:MAG: hypothetical protein ACR2OF_00675 [Hyphomicrobium sp.]
MDVFFGVLIGLIIAIIAILVFSFIFMWIWNLVMPDVFGLKQVTLWQALGILILASILFGGHRVVNVYQLPPQHVEAPRPA